MHVRTEIMSGKWNTHATKSKIHLENDLDCAYSLTEPNFLTSGPPQTDNNVYVYLLTTNDNML